MHQGGDGDAAAPPLLECRLRAEHDEEGHRDTKKGMDAAVNAWIEGWLEYFGQGEHNGALCKDHPKEKGGGRAPTNGQKRLRPPAGVVGDMVYAVGKERLLPRLGLPVLLELRLQQTGLLEPPQLGQVLTLHHPLALHIRDHTLPELALQANHGRQIQAESRS